MEKLRAKRHVTLAIAPVAVFFLLCGCGGGGHAVDNSAAASTVIVKTVGAATTLYGLQFKIELAPGVTLATDASGELASGAIVPSGGAAGAMVVTNYQRSVEPQTVTVSLVKPLGFSVGEFLTLTAQVAPGASFSPADLTLSEFKAYDDLESGAVQESITGAVAAP